VKDWKQSHRCRRELVPEQNNRRLQTLIFAGFDGPNIYGALGKTAEFRQVICLKKLVSEEQRNFSFHHRMNV